MGPFICEIPVGGSSSNRRARTNRKKSLSKSISYIHRFSGRTGQFFRTGKSFPGKSVDRGRGAEIRGRDKAALSLHRLLCAQCADDCSPLPLVRCPWPAVRGPLVAVRRPWSVVKKPLHQTHSFMPTDLCRSGLLLRFFIPPPAGFRVTKQVMR